MGFLSACSWHLVPLLPTFSTKPSFPCPSRRLSSLETVFIVTMIKCFQLLLIIINGVYHFLRIYHLSGTVPSALCDKFISSSHRLPESYAIPSLPVTDEGAEGGRSEMTCSRSQVENGRAPLALSARLIAGVLSPPWY